MTDAPIDRAGCPSPCPCLAPLPAVQDEIDGIVRENDADGATDILSLQALRASEPPLDLRHVDLVALSACNTFKGGADESGVEIEGMGAIIQPQERDGHREIVRLHQAKRHMPKEVELAGPVGDRYRLAGAICYDATDLALAADLRDTSDCLVIAALNKDVRTFDAMVQALHYHMFQPVILANSGQYGGSTVQAPYRERYDKLVAHVHGAGQVAVSVFELDLAAFRSRQRGGTAKVLKAWPAGYQGRRH